MNSIFVIAVVFVSVLTIAFSEKSHPDICAIVKDDPAVFKDYVQCYRDHYPAEPLDGFTNCIQRLTKRPYSLEDYLGCEDRLSSILPESKGVYCMREVHKYWTQNEETFDEVNEKTMNCVYETLETHGHYFRKRRGSPFIF